MQNAFTKYIACSFTQKAKEVNVTLLWLLHPLQQACQTGGLRAKCGPFACFLRPE